MMLLLAVYGWRGGEVRGLKLEDIDWDNAMLRPSRPKQRRVGVYPLSQRVGDAIIAYLKVRPVCRCRSVFVTERQPYRPLSSCGLGTMIQNRQKALGQTLRRYGAHGLRHACATYLLAEGFTLKQIGDHLGHTMIRATEAYAKVDLKALAQVGDVAFPELIECDRRCAEVETPFYTLGGMDGLRAVADLTLKGMV
jgi:integrase